MPPPEHRLVVVAPLAPAAAFTAFRTFWRNNVVQAGDGDDDPAVWPGLNAAGDTSAATHRWWSGALPDTVFRRVVVAECQLAAITPPTARVWAGWTKTQRIAWLASVRSALRAATGRHLDLSGQVGGAWTSPDAVLAVVGLKRQKTAGL